MDAAHILVAVLTTAPWVGWCGSNFNVLATMSSRRRGTAEEGNSRHSLPQTNSELETMKALSAQKAKLGIRPRGGRHEERGK